MSLWTILKRALYKVLYTCVRFSFTPVEKALIDAVVAELPHDEAQALRIQITSFEYLQRLHKGRILGLWYGRYTGPLLSRTDTQCCLARVKFGAGGKSMVANLIAIRGTFQMLQFRRAPASNASVTVEEIVLYPEKYVDVEEAVHRREHGREGV